MNPSSAYQDDVVSYGFGPTSSLNRAHPNSTSPKIKHPIVSPYTSPRIVPAGTMDLDDSGSLPIPPNLSRRRASPSNDPDPISASTYDRFMGEFISSNRTAATTSALDGPLSAKPSFVVSPAEAGQIPDQSSISRSKSRTKRDYCNGTIPLTSHRHHRSSSGSNSGSPKLSGVGVFNELPATHIRSSSAGSSSSYKPAFFIRTFGRSKTPEYTNDLVTKLMNENPNFASQSMVSASSALGPAPPAYSSSVFLDGPSPVVYPPKPPKKQKDIWVEPDEDRFEQFPAEPVISAPPMRRRSSQGFKWKSLVNSGLNILRGSSNAQPYPSPRGTVLPNGQILKSSLKNPNGRLAEPSPDEISFTVVGDYILEIMSKFSPLLFLVDFINSLSATEFYYLRTPAIFIALFFIGWFIYYLLLLIEAIFAVIRVICSPVVLIIDLIFGSHHA